MMRTIHLHGALGRRYGMRTVRLAVATAAEAVRALDAQLPGFREFVRSRSWHVVAGPDIDSGEDRGREELMHVGLGQKDLHFVPVVAGASQKSGILSIITGIAMIAIGIINPGAAGVMWGAIISGSMAVIGGTVSLLSPQPSLGKFEDLESQDSKPSAFFSRPVNTFEQGHPVPLVYGRFLVGGPVASAGMSAEDAA